MLAAMMRGIRLALVAKHLGKKKNELAASSLTAMALALRSQAGREPPDFSRANTHLFPHNHTVTMISSVRTTSPKPGSASDLCNRMASYSSADKPGKSFLINAMHAPSSLVFSWWPTHLNA